eukprot:PhF_6_TR26378/c0_g1_i9/m.38044
MSFNGDVILHIIVYLPQDRLRQNCSLVNTLWYHAVKSTLEDNSAVFWREMERLEEYFVKQYSANEVIRNQKSPKEITVLDVKLNDMFFRVCNRRTLPSDPPPDSSDDLAQLMALIAQGARGRMTYDSCPTRWFPQELTKTPRHAECALLYLPACVLGTPRSLLYSRCDYSYLTDIILSCNLAQPDHITEVLKHVWLAGKIVTGKGCFGYTYTVHAANPCGWNPYRPHQITFARLIIRIYEVSATIQGDFDADRAFHDILNANVLYVKMKQT